MRILRPKGLWSGFSAVELSSIIPEIIEAGEHWEAAKYRVSPHSHGHWEVGYLSEGTGRLRIVGGNEILLSSGSIWCLAPNVNHSLAGGPEPKHHFFWVGFDLGAIESKYPRWNASQSLRRTYSLGGVRCLEGHFLQIVREVTTPSLYQSSGLRLALDAMVLGVVRAITEPGQVSSLVRLHPAIFRTLGILESRFKEGWTLRKLAEEVGLSESRLKELFRQEAGSSIHKVLTKARVRHAEKLLIQSDLPICEIATDCGFATLQHCSRVFKGVTGQTPFEFRRLAASKRH